MDDGFGFGRNTSGRSGYDVGPGEDRGRFFQGTPVDMLTVRQNSLGGMEMEYQQVFVARRPGEIFSEPFDETVTTSNPIAESRNIAYATDSRYYSEAERLKTFQDRWLEDYHVKPKDLARDGFIHIGPGDKVKCVFCLKTLRGWEVGDSVEGEHRRHYPFCPWVKGECDSLNIPLNATESMKKSFGLKMKPTGESAVSCMQDFSQRLKSFEGWPRQAHIRPDALAEAGLYYTGTSDKAICFSCGQALANWEPGDDPWCEHAKWSPYCPYVHSIKGSEYVKQILEKGSEHLGSVRQQSSTEQESNMIPRSREVNQAAASSGTTMERELETRTPDLKPQLVSRSHQETVAEIEQEINSAPVKAILETYDIPLEKMRVLLEAVKISGDDNFKQDPVKSLLEMYDIPVETLREMLAKVTVTKDGASHQPE
ncbi:unnamed protein product [Candidula unifasciata]|uniref:Uncharacterized protein n=1 Tax=Candidula unifasciata TaxID=100452 RepID=A0A8S3ZAX6_9EUPU|nr:unnamed protein product [Candidula unifasciata]